MSMSGEHKQFYEELAHYIVAYAGSDDSSISRECTACASTNGSISLANVQDREGH